jgi:hypothetical protein
MWIRFEDMPGHSRVWIFQAERTLGDGEEMMLDLRIRNFLEDWTSHQRTIRASYEIHLHRFVILAVDEDQVGASGCSIDKLFRFVQSLESEMGFVLLDKQKIALQQAGGIVSVPLHTLKEKVRAGEMDKEEKYFDLMIAQKESLGEFLKPLSSGWLARYLSNEFKDHAR